MMLWTWASSNSMRLRRMWGVLAAIRPTLRRNAERHGSEVVEGHLAKPFDRRPIERTRGADPQYTQRLRQHSCAFILGERRRHENGVGHVMEVYCQVLPLTLRRPAQEPPTGLDHAVIWRSSENRVERQRGCMKQTQPQVWRISSRHGGSTCAAMGHNSSIRAEGVSDSAV